MTSPIPVVFLHGLRLHATSWEPWIDLFGHEGYAPSAPGWPGDPDTGEEARARLKQYRHSEAVTDITDITDFPDRGHSLTIDSGWREVADTALEWLHGQSL